MRSKSSIIGVVSSTHKRKSPVTTNTLRMKHGVGMMEVKLIFYPVACRYATRYADIQIHVRDILFRSGLLWN
ncbi:hypothetical protein L1987_06438 [Smallanthus sonchifolius]|uniref:Uncharacterized protein n=1 Tax=Smallanthus sonchifolius TaxID=185202 RepID=A0ACB9JYB3_9ASTR|nr:hypothetical protein L1987_06438 [Smallanthus sonchifolius]